MTLAPRHCALHGGAGGWTSSLDEREGSGGAGLELISQQPALAFRECPQRLGLADVIPAEELPATGGSPATLAHQQFPDRPAVRRSGRVQDDLRGGCVSLGDPSLQLRAGEPDRVGSFQCSHPLRRWAHRGGLTHLVLRFLPFGPPGRIMYTNGQGSGWAPSHGSCGAHCYSRAHARTDVVTPVSAFPTSRTAWSARPSR